MVQFAASNIKLTCLQNGADFLSDDDIYMNVNGFKFGFGFGSSLQQAPGFANNTRPGAKEMRTGDTATLDPITGTTTIGSVFYLPDGKFSPNAKSIDIIPFSNNISFDVFDADAGVFEGGDDFIGATSYVAKGTEPLMSQGAFHFINNMNGGGSKYRLDYDINKLPGSTTGKLASKDGGVMNGSNKDGTLVGLNGKDIINANDGDDLVIGGGNDDTLNGDKGDDLIFGDKGNDTLSGGAGRDTFVIARNNGLDTIKDFRTGRDSIGLGGGLKFENLSFVKSGKDMSIKAGGKELALVQGVHSPLTVTDFTQIDLGNLNSLVKTDVAALTKKPSLAA